MCSEEDFNELKRMQLEGIQFVYCNETSKYRDWTCFREVEKKTRTNTELRASRLDVVRKIRRPYINIVLDTPLLIVPVVVLSQLLVSLPLHFGYCFVVYLISAGRSMEHFFDLLLYFLQVISPIR